MQLMRQDVALSAARVWAGARQMCRKERGTFVSPARAVPQESAISAPSLGFECLVGFYKLSNQYVLEDFSVGKVRAAHFFSIIG